MDTQFKKLWANLMKWQYTFDQHNDNEENNYLQFEHLGSALGMLGYVVGEVEVVLLRIKYEDRRGVLMLEDYLLLCARCAHARSVFKRSAARKEKETLESFVLKMLYI